jgi:hypothetical protein
VDLSHFERRKKLFTVRLSVWRLNVPSLLAGQKKSICQAGRVAIPAGDREANEGLVYIPAGKEFRGVAGR